MEAYRDETLPARERAKDLVSRMTIEEKVSQLRYNALPVERLGIPAYNWWNEALHGVARAGVATVFPQAIGLAAMFDEEFLGDIASTIATEARAKYNAAQSKGDRDIYKGLTFWSPNINIFRDPRWGRGHETYGEDPFLTARLGVAFIKGLQGEGKVLKAAACAKHFAVHSGPEGLRHEFDAEVSQKDLYETYLPAFEAAVKEGNVEAVMGAYNRVGGEPCCGSTTLLGEILRGKWGFEGHVVSDCGAIADFHNYHKVTRTAEESAAMALKAGCDINCGQVYLHIMSAYEQGLVAEQDIDAAVIRAMTTRMKLGMFDAHCEYNAIPYVANDTKEHAAQSLEAARRSIVLLKNDGILPLAREKLRSVAIIGPNADSIACLEGNYAGTASRYTTLLEGIRDALPQDVRVFVAQGSDMAGEHTSDWGLAGDRLGEAACAAESADVSIVCVGLDATLEGEQGDANNAFEAGDKRDLQLPNAQRLLLDTVLAVGKPVVVVLAAGSSIALGDADERANAIVDVWYPGAQGGKALAELLFGEYSPSGRLPLTFYRDIADLPPFEDYAMKGRTYRYFEGEPLNPFGYGLSFTSFAYGGLAVSQARPGEDAQAMVRVKNTGKRAGAEIVQAYIRPLDCPLAPPNPSLCAFTRVELMPGEEKLIELTIPAQSLSVVDESGERVYAADRFELYVGGSQPDSRSAELTGAKPLMGVLGFAE